jgi:hypothetical protein
MTKETLQMIIEDNFTKAKHGDLHAIGVIAGAQAELKKIDTLEKDISFGKIIAQEKRWEENYA